MYITLTLTPDKNGFQGQVALNVNRINGFRDIAYTDIGGNTEKDLAGYPETYTEVLMKGCSMAVAEPIPTILEKIRDSKMRDDRNRS
jgi:hypothetical protein